MKNIYILIAMLTAVCLSNYLNAQNFHVLDINNSKDAHPSNNSIYDYTTPDFLYGKFKYAVLKGIAYFAADDGIHGWELWRSDGTEAGTSMVKDITTGIASSYIARIITCGNKIYFTVGDDANRALYVSDGTGAGTVMLNAYSPTLSPSFLTDVNGILYFYAGNYNQIWKSDGTIEGTVMVVDLYSEGIGYTATQLTNVNGSLYFVMQSYYYGIELYTIDRTTGSTHLVKDINPYGDSNPTQLTAAGGLLCFAANDGFGKQLWVTDGTEAGTYKASNPANVYVDDYYGITFAVKNKTIYFSGNINDSDGNRFCAYNTANASNEVKIIKDINPGSLSKNLYNITNVNGTLFFTVFNGYDQVLWKSDGTKPGTVQVKNINPGGRNIYLYKDFENANGTLLFTFYDDEYGYELWKSDGTEAGTTIVKDISPGPSDSRSDNITYIGNGISLFEATDGKKGLELWRTDGTDAGTSMVRNINKSVSSSSNPSLLMQSADSSKLLFVADDLKFGTELRITDGTQEGTSVVKDLFKGSFGSSPYSFANFKNETYFLAYIPDTANHTTSDVTTTAKLCKTDGTRAGTKILSLPSLEALLNASGGAYTEVNWMGASSNLLYLYIIDHSNYQAQLWRSDGTEAGTFPIQNNLYYYYTSIFKVIGDKLFFTNYDYIYGYELFVTNGSVGGMGIVKDINPGPYGSNPSNFSMFNGKLYFTADAGYGPFVWSSDGTLAGTNAVKPLTVAYNPFVQTNDKLFFIGSRNVGVGTELYTINKPGNIQLVKDLYKGPASSNIYNLTAGDTLVYFTADDGKHGLQLWKSNGTKEGTKIILTTIDIGNSYLDNFITIHNKLFFTKNNVLWQSDGTDEETHIVDDENLLNVTSLANFTAFNNKLAFTGYEPSTGTELYVGDAEVENFVANNSTAAAPLAKVNTTLSFSIFPNPARSAVTAIISGNIKNASVTITDMSGKTVWQSNNINQPRISLPTERLAAGVYTITLKTDRESKTQKLVKE